MKNPSTLIFLGLAVVWAIVLLPEGIKKLSRVRRPDSIRSFNQQLSVLDRSGPSRRNGDVIGGAGRRPVKALGARPSVNTNVIDLRERRSATSHKSARPQNLQASRTAVSTVPGAVRKRRQEITATLAAVSVLSLLCVIAFGSAFLIVNLVSVALLVGYLVLVSQANKNSQATHAMRSRAGSSIYSGASVARLDSNGIRAVTTGSVPAIVDTRSARRSV